MKSLDEALRTIIEKCEIVYSNEFEGDYILSKESLMKTYSEFLLCNVENGDKNNITSLILNAKSVCYDVINMLYLILGCIVNNESDSESVLRQLRPGDLVIYGGNRQKFVGISDSEFGCRAVLEYTPKKTKRNPYPDVNTNYVPQSMWNKITPYYGEAGEGKKGIKKANKNVMEFYVECLGCKVAEIPNEISLSSVIVSEKDSLIDIYKNTSIKIDDNTIKFSDIVTATYYASEDSYYQIGSNQTKSEPVLKFTSRISTARKLVKNKRGNSNYAVLISDINVCCTESDLLLDITTNRKINETIISLPIETDYNSVLNIVGLQNIDKLYAVTKDFIISYPLGDALNNVNSVRLSQKIDNIIDKEITTKYFDDLNEIDVDLFKKNIKVIKSSEIVEELRDEFVIQSFSLWKLFENAPFNLRDMENLISQHRIRPQSPRARIDRLSEIADMLPNAFLKDVATNIVETLQKIYYLLLDNNPKARLLLKKFRYSTGKMSAVIVDKPYYKTILESNGSIVRTPAFTNGKLKFYTPSKFNNSRDFDEIITFGTYADKNFNLFSCISSKDILVCLYNCQSKVFDYYATFERKNENLLNEKATLEYDFDEFVDVEDKVEELKVEVENEKTLVDEINALRFKGRSVYTYDPNYSGPTTETVKTVYFDSGEQAFFTKNYKPFFYDDFDKEIIDKGIDSINIGDVLIFTKGDSSAVDIVDGILQEIVESSEENKNIIDNYEKSKRWKKSLQKYLLNSSKCAREIAKELKQAGVTVELQTIIGWLDYNCQTVRPRDIENLEIISKFIEDREMCLDIESYYNSGSIIYDYRRLIKNEIKTVYAEIVKGKDIDQSSILYSIKNQIKEMFEMYTVEHINDEIRQIPNNKTNKPI